MDFIPGNLSNDLRLVGPAGAFGGGLGFDLFGAVGGTSGGGGLMGSQSIIPTPRPDPAAESSPEMLKMRAAASKHLLPARCSFPRPGALLRDNHNAGTSGDLGLLLPSPSPPDSPVKALGFVGNPAAVAAALMGRPRVTAAASAAAAETGGEPSLSF